MSLTPEQNAAWCRKCIAIINGDDNVKEPQLRTFAAMDKTEIETTEEGLCIRQERTDGSGTEDAIFIPSFFVDQFINELAEVSGLA